MSNKRLQLLSLIVFGILFQALFYQHGMGLNTLVFTLSVITLLFLFQKKPQTPISILLLAGFCVATLGVIIGHTHYSLVIYWIAFFLYIAAIVFPALKYVHYAPKVVLSASLQLTGVLFSLSPKQHNKGRLGAWLKFVFIPIVLFFTLLVLYAGSNTFFNKSIASIFQYIAELFETFSFGRILFALFGIGIGGYFLIEELSEQLLNKHEQAHTALVRTKNTNRKIKGLSRLLLRKQQVAIVFFVLINLMALGLNILDIKHLWLNFSWDGGYLRDMVREGTFMLIVAILISMGITLYYLNSNLVFMKNHRLFQTLITIWLAQNMLMVISVVFRNSYYIQYFGLAYKRIFVYFFLAACVVGLVSIIYKSITYKSATYLFAVNSLSVYLICITAACFNWDAIIARYNFSHYKTSFVHYEFLATLNNAALPYLPTDTTLLNQIDDKQLRRFSFSSRGAYEKINFSEAIEKRKLYFTQAWDEYSWLDWNLPEAKAYKILE
jgi:hypothetical protein